MRIRKITGENAVLTNGRKVRLGGVTDVKSGDYIEVYADIALGKVEVADVKAIAAARLRGGGTS